MLAGMLFFVRKLKFLQRKKANVKEKKNIFKIRGKLLYGFLENIESQCFGAIMKLP